MSVGIVTNANETGVQTQKLVAAAARSKGQLVRISTGNTTYGVNDDITIADDTNVYRVAVVNQDVASGSVYDAVHKGTVTLTVPSGTYTTGHGLKILDGAIASTGAAAGDSSGEVGDTSFAIIKEGGTSVTSIRATLYGFAFTATT